MHCSVGLFINNSLPFQDTSDDSNCLSFICENWLFNTKPNAPQIFVEWLDLIIKLIQSRITFLRCLNNIMSGFKWAGEHVCWRLFGFTMFIDERRPGTLWVVSIPWAGGPGFYESGGGKVSTSKQGLITALSSCL